MEFDRLLDDCVALENAISALIETNANKEFELNALKTRYLDDSQSDLDQFAERELELKRQLEVSRSKKEELDTEIKHFTEINEKLSDWVSIAQKTNNDKNNIEDKNHEVHMMIVDAAQDYEQIKANIQKIIEDTNELMGAIGSDTEKVVDVIRTCNNLVTDLHRNDRLIKVLDQQNKHGEQQFDLILQQLPWEPLTNLHELSNHNESRVQDIAGVLQVQAAEINDLIESLNAKKQKKLVVLNELNNQLNQFIKKRGEAMLMEYHNNEISSNSPTSNPNGIPNY